MKYRLLSFLLTILMITSVISIGFSSWNIVSGVEHETLSGNITSDKITNFNEYITISNISSLKYNKDGFLGDNKLKSSIKSKIQIDIYNVLLTFGVLDKLQIVIDLKYIDGVPSDMNIFDYVTAECRQNDILITNVSSESNKDIQEYVTTITLNSFDSYSKDSKYYEFDLEYIIEFSDSSFFNNPESPLLNKSYPIFTMTSVLYLN